MRIYEVFWIFVRVILLLFNDYSIRNFFSYADCRTLINSKGKGLSLPCRHNTYQVKNAGDTGAGFSGKLLIGGSLLAAVSLALERNYYYTYN